METITIPQKYAFLFLLAGVLALLGNAPQPDAKRDLAATGLFPQFQESVIPVLDRRCGNCHGLTQEHYKAFEQETSNHVALRWIVDDSGRIPEGASSQLAYKRCTEDRQADGRALRPIIRSGPAVASPMVRAPLAETLSGMAGHPEVFATLDDPDCAALMHWVDAEIKVRPDSVRPFSEAERIFAEDVTPVLLRKTCFGMNCHGPRAFSDLKLDPGIPAFSELFTPEMHRKNREAMLGSVTRLVNFSGDVTQSKQVVKNIPVSEGGIVHKGGNNFFATGDPDYQALLRWLEVERRDAEIDAEASLGTVDGFVFVRRPKDSPERFFEVNPFLPGGDLFWRRSGEEINLTGKLHPGATADIRGPDVSYDARSAVFAMRRGEDEAFDIWEVDLASGDARQLTFSSDPTVHYLDPLYVPDPLDASGRDLGRAGIVMVSNRAGERCESSPAALLGEAEGGTHDAIVDEQRTEKPGTFNGKRIQIVRGTNAGEERAVVTQERGKLVLDRPLPESCDSTTHYTIALASRLAPRFDGYRMRRAEPGNEKAIFETTLTQMTYSASQVRRPTLRSSGEIVFTALRTGWQDNRPYFNGALYRTHIDGSNFHPHNGNRSGIPIHCDDREMPNGLEVRIGRDADSWWGGMLMLSDHQFGPTIEAHNSLDNFDHPYRNGVPEHSGHRFVPGWISLDGAAAAQGISMGGAYRDPYPMPDGSILVAHASGPVDLHDPDAAPNFDILQLKPDPAFQSDDGFAAGSYTREAIIDGPETELWPRPVAARLKESAHKTLKNEPNLLGPPQSDTGYPRYAPDTPAIIKIFDVPLLDAFFEQTAPMGTRHIAEEICPICNDVTSDIDQIHYVRIVAGKAGAQEDSEAIRRAIIAELPVEEDGSLFASVPPAISFDIQTLNRHHMALRSPNRWLYCLPGEQHTLSIPRKLFPQTCGGCHGGLSGRSADTLRRPDAVTAASRTLAMWDDELKRKRVPANWNDGVQSALQQINFDPDIATVLEAKCVSCHAAANPQGGLSLERDTALESLKAYTAHKEGMAIKSYLIEKLMGRELHAPRSLKGDTPHPSQNPLTEAEMLAFVRWIDLGAQS